MSQLTIYKASAGSGKTYRITGEYLKLLFQNPDNYRHILGVTFTNKATAEMKSRIINELFKLSRGDKSGYISEISESERIKPDEIQRKSALLLYKILHDYSHFSITTIDSFFQKVIRTFGREIGLYQGYEVELEQDKILEASIEQMILNIDKHPELKDWLVRFAEDKIMDGKSWNIVSDIQSLGNELFKEKYKELADKLHEKIADKNFVRNFNHTLKDYATLTESKIIKLAGEAKSIILASGLNPEDFKGKSRSIAANFIKWADNKVTDRWNITPTLRKCLNNPEEWYPAKSENQQQIENLYHKGLNRIFNDLLQIYDNDFVIYRSIIKVQKNLYVLGLIADLQTYIRDYTSDKNLFLISDTAQFLNKLIDGSDAPFIYERTGTYIDHFMIDEFQDTSVLQWKNFKPLIINSLAQGTQNWVVGDVKQSIYRWRNSDWTILSGKIRDDILPHPISTETLNYNWRSCRNIVKFNNSFFQNAISELIQNEDVVDNENGTNPFSQVLADAYIAFEQLVPESKPDEGIVSIEHIITKGKKDKDWQNQVLTRLPVYLINLFDAGYRPVDIAILVRDKKDAKLVADFFLNYQKTPEAANYRFDILSGDSLLLKNAKIVKWLIACFKYIISPDDKINSSYLSYQYTQFIQNQDKRDISTIFDHQGEIVLEGNLAEYFKNDSLKQLSIFELTDELIIHFNLNTFTNELPYLQAFQELLHNYLKREPADLHTFLKWWESNKEKQVISMPENQDAMKLMTIHSAKGLEFPVVIIPFCDWEIMKSSQNNNYLWCEPQSKPLNEMDLLPVNMSSGLESTIFKSDYLREKALLYVDNLNLLYVAFTRAINALHIFLPDYEEENIKNNLATLISRCIKHQQNDTTGSNFPAAFLPQFYNQHSAIFQLGNIPVPIKKTLSGTDWLMNNLNYTVRNIADVTQQVTGSSEYFGNSDTQLSTHLQSGKIMHEIFQQIKTIEDVNKALLKVYSEGKISFSDIEQLKNLVIEYISNPQAQSWFSKDWDLKIENSAILPDKSIQRPDRVLIKNNKAVVIDYKFGDEEKAGYISQVSGYMKFLQQMGYQNIEGYIWYVTKNRIIPVHLQTQQGKLF